MATKILPHRLRELDPQSEQDNLGSGVAFPIRVNASGETKVTTGEENVKSCIYHIATYRRGDLYGTLGFGGHVPAMVFTVFSGDKLKLHEDWLQSAIDNWEPRVTDVRVTAGKDVNDNSNTKVVMLTQFRIESVDSETYTLLPVETE